jgi:hypothetical protein
MSRATRRSLPTVTAGILFALGAVGDAAAGEWEQVRDSYEGALKTYEKRIGDIEAKERGIADPMQRADKITRDKITSVRTTLRSSGKGKSLADAAEKASGDPKALPDLTRDQGEYLDAVRGDWGPDGPERKKLRDATATVQKNLERASANLTKAAKAPAAVSTPEALEKAAQVETTLVEAGERVKARWQLEQAARERETKQREREAAERSRAGK